MNNNVKFALILALALIVSMATSYVTTLSLNQTNQQQFNRTSPQPSSSPSVQPTSTPTPQLEGNKITISEYKTHFESDYNFDSFTGNVKNSYVMVYYKNPLRNLTIIYNYTCLNGTIGTAEFCYGDYSPTVHPAQDLGEGDVFTCYLIPHYIVSACSSAKPIYYPSGNINYIEWVTYPKVTATVYGYS